MKTRLLSLLLILTLAICMMIPLASCEKKPPRLPVNENGSESSLVFIDVSFRDRYPI